MVIKEVGKPGDVMVIDGGGDHSCALLGMLMVSAARKMGVAGVTSRPELDAILQQKGVE